MLNGQRMNTTLEIGNEINKKTTFPVSETHGRKFFTQQLIYYFALP